MIAYNIYIYIYICVYIYEEGIPKGLKLRKVKLCMGVIAGQVGKL